jgi:hypothetical protein
MPEVVTSSPPAPSAPVSSTLVPSAEPTSSRSIIEASIAEMPDRDDDDSESSAEPSESTASSSPASATPLTAQEKDELAELLGIGDRVGPGKWTSRIAYSKIHKVIGERDAQRKAEHDAALKGHTDKIGEYEKRLDAISQVERIMYEEPDRFIEMLSSIPAYHGRFGSSRSSTHPQAGSERPGPDIRYQDGSTAYSEEGLQRLLDWNAAQVEKRLTSRIAPFEHERQVKAIEAAAAPKIQAMLTEAAKWPMFTENEAAILQVLQSEPQTSLEAAYQRVVLPKLAANRDSLRQEILKELAERPHSTVTRTATSGRSGDDAPRDSRDIISRVVSELESQG